MELYLIRHGHTQPEKAHFDESKKAMDPPLSGTGWAQAEQLGRRLESVKFDAIYCSDLTRALCTAKLLGSFVRCSIFVEPALREIDMGRAATQIMAGLSRAS